MKIFSKKLGFTFVEIILSTMISVIILIFTFSFLADTMDGLTTSDKKSKILASFYDVVAVIDNYKHIYLTGNILIDNLSASGSDVLLLKDFDGNYGVVFGVIDKNSMKLESGSLFDVYNSKIFGYKEVNSGQLNTISSTPNLVYDLDFTHDHFFQFPVRSFQVDFYNTGSLLDFNLDILVDYNEGFSGQLWRDVPISAYELYKLNLDF